MTSFLFTSTTMAESPERLGTPVDAAPATRAGSASNWANEKLIPARAAAGSGVGAGGAGPVTAGPTAPPGATPTPACGRPADPADAKGSGRGRKSPRTAQPTARKQTTTIA